jgi:hypothetical protein
VLVIHEVIVTSADEVRQLRQLRAAEGKQP